VKNGSMGTPRWAYEVAAAMNVAIDPASVMPSSRIWPSFASVYDSSSWASTGSYTWPWAA
jgi:hypothetical protein